MFLLKNSSLNFVTALMNSGKENNRMNHLHRWKKLEKKKKGTESVWICAHPNCYAKSSYNEIFGKESGCTKCGRSLILNGETIRRANPLCLDCSNTREARLHREVEQLKDQTTERLKALGLLPESVQQ